MSNIEKKKFIIDNLSNIKSLDNYKEHYKYILDIVKESNVNITKNKRGYYFNLNSIDDESVDTIFSYVKSTTQN